MVLPDKNLKNKDFVSLTQILKLLVWVPKIVENYIIVTHSVIAWLQFDLKRAFEKYHISSFSVFFRQAVTKIMGKTANLTVLGFYSLPPLNNVERQ